MKRVLYSLIICLIALGNTLLWAKTGVIVHEKDGKTTFIPSEEIEYIELIEGYTTADPEEPNEPENPGDNQDPEEPENPGENQDPEEPENPSENQEPEEPENPGNNQDPEEPENPGETQDPEEPENPGENQDPEEPANPGENQDPEEPENPGETQDPEEPENPGENQDPEEPENPGENQDPEEPENPGENHDPEEPENPGENHDPEEPENPGENQDPEGPEIPGENQDPEKPENPGESQEPEEPENPGENQDPVEPENPGENQDPEEPENPGENQDPEEPENPGESSFHLLTENTLPVDRTYLIVANGVCATPVATTYSYGYLPSKSVTITNNTIENEKDNGFLFTTTCIVNGKEYSAPAGKFMIKDSNDRYLYLTGTYTSYNLASAPTLSNGKIDDNYLFTASKSSGDKWIISNTKNGDKKSMAYSSKYNNFAAYNTLSNNDTYPTLYILGDNQTLPGEDPGTNDEPNDPTDPEEPPYSPVPDDYIYPLSYVKLPDGTPQQIKEYTGFTLNFNKDNHTANYVAWELLDSETSGSVDRNKYDYWVDSEIEGCLSKDFAYSTYSYERGHICPAADQKWSTSAMKDCMVMTNMVPQLRQLNSGLWGSLEDKERTWAKRDGALWIIAGPVYSDDDDLYIGAAKARVPSACFKAFFFNDPVKPRAIAFVFQNGSNPGNIQDYAMSIDELEELLGFDFFSALPDEIEETVEATYNFSDWNK